MKNLFRLAIASLMMVATPLFAATNNMNGTLVGKPTTVSNKLAPILAAEMSSAELITYKMPSIRGGEINATAILYLPKGNPPKEGWPLVVFGHGTVGLGQQCGPTVQMMKQGYDTWHYEIPIANILKIGIPVLEVDYEGLGSADYGVPNYGEPYYNKLSEARAINYGAVAAKNLLGDKLSGEWAAVGHSQGGQAVVAAAEFSDLAHQQNPAMQYKGTVAYAPLFDVIPVLQQGFAELKKYSDEYNYLGVDGELAKLNEYLVLFSLSMIQSGYPLDINKMFGARMQAIIKNHGKDCYFPLLAAINEDIDEWRAANPSAPYDQYAGAKPSEFLAESAFAKAILEQEVSLHIPGKTLILQGNADNYVLAPVTTNRVNAMVAHGSDVTYVLMQGHDHDGVMRDPHSLGIVQDFLKKIFKPY